MLRPWLPRLLAVLFVLIGVLRIASTWHAFSQVFDEPAHIASGMQWLSTHTYTYEAQHPPLARVVAALGPWLAGFRSTGNAEMFAEGNAILASHGPIANTLAQARAGILLFYILTCATVYLWGRWTMGEWAALIATGLVAVLPPILGQSGIATTDMGLAATLTLALYLWCRFLEAPSYARAAAVGLSVAAAVMTKFTAIPFFGASALVVWVRYAFSHERPPGRQTWPMWLTLTTDRAIAPQGHFNLPWDTVSGVIQHLLPGFRIPASELFWGFDVARIHNSLGHTSYLFGEIRQFGWWYFFPVVLAVKTPLPLLLLALYGIVLSLRSNWRTSAPALAALAIFAGCLTANVNLGVRHILPIYPLLALPASLAVVALWRWRKLAAIVPLLWLTWNTAQAHPSYFAWFNELAGSHPERILAESDLDWGQDLPALRDAMRAKGNPAVAIIYFGTGDPGLYGLKNYRWLPDGEIPKGWFAISLRELMFKPATYRWLDGLPSEPVGQSIRLYNVP
jgi:hypothetical protein